MLFVPKVCHYQSQISFHFSICRMHILVPFPLAGAWYLGRNHLICYFDFSPPWRPAIFWKFFHICVRTHTPFLFVVSEYSSFPKDFYHICTASKGQNTPFSPRNEYLRPGPRDILPLSFHQALNESLRTSTCFTASHESAQGQHLEVTGWDGHRIKELSVCSFVCSKIHVASYFMNDSVTALRDGAEC